VVEALEGPLILNVCVAEGPTCQRKNWCSVHRVWAEAQNALAAVLRGATMKQLADEAAENRTLCGGSPWN
jgi:DNA-binding IscR family transcriptional regulator